MDRFICHCDAAGDYNVRTIIRGVKKKFHELKGVVLVPEAVERRILCLDQQETDYFVEGMKTAVANAEAKGFILPRMDFRKYARTSEDNEVS